MEKLNPRKFAIASGLVSVVVYLGCFIMMSLVGMDALVQLSNLLFHGMDFTNIVRTVSIGETILGTAVSFIFWGLLGYLMAFIYNKLN